MQELSNLPIALFCVDVSKLCRVPYEVVKDWILGGSLKTLSSDGILHLSPTDKTKDHFAHEAIGNSFLEDWVAPAVRQLRPHTALMVAQGTLPLALVQWLQDPQRQNLRDRFELHPDMTTVQELIGMAIVARVNDWANQPPPPPPPPPDTPIVYEGGPGDIIDGRCKYAVAG